VTQILDSGPAEASQQIQVSLCCSLCCSELQSALQCACPGLAVDSDITLLQSVLQCVAVFAVVCCSMSAQASQQIQISPCQRLKIKRVTAKFRSVDSRKNFVVAYNFKEPTNRSHPHTPGN